MHNKPSRSAVAELQRYDRDLGVRYSWEKKKWAITHRVLPIVRDHLPRPVRREQRPDGGIREVLRPEKSEAYLNWRDKTVVVAYVRHLTKSVIAEVLRTDGWVKGNGINKRIDAVEAKQEREYESKKKDRAHAAYDFMKHGWRRNIMSD